MGFPIKLNWVLQYDPEEHLEVGRVYSFEKGGNRVFPLNAKIDLISSSRTAIAKIKIRKCGQIIPLIFSCVLVFLLSFLLTLPLVFCLHSFFLCSLFCFQAL